MTTKEVTARAPDQSSALLTAGLVTVLSLAERVGGASLKGGGPSEGRMAKGTANATKPRACRAYKCSSQSLVG